MNSKPHSGLEVHVLPSPETLSLPEAKKIAGLTGDLPTEILGTFPNAGVGQRAEGLTRLTALNAAQKWSNDAYRWCVGMAGFSPSADQNRSFLTHSATHGEAPRIEEATMDYYRGTLRRMLETTENPADCDAVVFGGVNGHYSNEFRQRLAEMITHESGIHPTVIPPAAKDSMHDPKSKQVFVDTKGGRLFFFEPGLKKQERNRAYRLGGA